MEMRHVYWFLFIITSTLQLVGTGKHDDNPIVLNVQGIVGGRVQMHCVTDQPHNVSQFYLQKKMSDGKIIFINGFYSKTLNVSPEYKNRTIVYQTKLSVELLDLSPADEGEYSCIPFINRVPSQKTRFHLTVTANYSTPIITTQGCDNQNAYNCVIECSSSGGFPLSTVTWNIVGYAMSSLLKKEMDPVFTQDVHSQLWDVSHNFTLTCTRPLDIICSVGGVMSRKVSVCISADFCIST